ncbi:MAG: DNA polymerase III subunit beta, partial [Chloroflexi bacterium]|nr:DNA polymerase III subunit beta [Chloroflexota bacterium]
LSKALSTVGHAVAPRSTLPVTGHVLLNTDNGRLRLAGTNMDIAIVAWIPAEVDIEGSISVPARLFTDLISSLPTDRVELDLNRRSQTLIVRTSRFEANVKGLDASEFPRIDQVNEPPLVTIEASALCDAISDVQFAAAKDEMRPQLAGLLLRLRDNELTLVGCDSFRLSIRRLTFDNPVAVGSPQAGIDLIVPARTMQEVSRAFGGTEGTLTITTTPTRTQVLFHSESVDIVSRLIEGNYVDFARLLDQTSQHTVRVAVTTSDLQRAARFTSFVSRDANNALHLDIKPIKDENGPGTVTLQATAAQVGENVTEVDAVVEGGAAEINLDNTYLADAIAAIHTQQTAIWTTRGQMLPVLLKPVGGSHEVGSEEALHMIMPMHLNR